MNVIEITENEFNEKIKDKEKVLIDCYAPWCGPCKMLSPIIDEIAKEKEDVEFYKINIDDAPKIAEKYAIMSIPTLLFLKNNKLVKTEVGFKTKEELLELIGN